MTNESSVTISPYRQGADDGLRFGAYLSVLFFSSIFAPRIPGFGLLSLILAIGVPVVIAWYLGKYNRNCNFRATFSMMWTQGVIIFVCGCLISGVLLFIYMKWMNPHFIITQWQHLVDIGAQSASPDLNNMGQVASKMIEAGMLPSAIEVVVEIVLMGVASGSILSLIIAAFIGARNRRRRLAQN